ncbi:MAG: tRNA (adenosine(37)-N6)-threonylcarbamoyltransferase complex ATPase subunit type 1 TsaE [Gammaproteobacteria bacterium]|nr:tRNA (adenosine(37)-N6)-threonylcarbamoyltransferase complex ATPase subunit type 1 TsaE [Gammaproteobacteria bacterium]
MSGPVRSWFLPGPEDTDRLARAVAGPLLELSRERPLCVALEGELGSGKTSWVRAMLQGLGYTGRVVSPTYTLLEPYSVGDFTVLHLDLYRLSDPGELEFLGLQDMVCPGTVICAEWPGRGRGVLPEPDLELAFSYQGEGRRVAMSAFTAAGADWLEVVAKQASMLHLPALD